MYTLKDVQQMEGRKEKIAGMQKTFNSASQTTNRELNCLLNTGGANGGGILLGSHAVLHFLLRFPDDVFELDGETSVELQTDETKLKI